jgi:hypothetical protein
MTSTKELLMTIRDVHRTTHMRFRFAPIVVLANIGADLVGSGLGHKLSNLKIALASEPIHEVAAR